MGREWVWGVFSSRCTLALPASVLLLSTELLQETGAREGILVN